MSENEPHDSIENAMETMKIEETCNWDNLPNELKVLCIEKTDIKTRANLMLSNRHNKMLFESIKYPLSYVFFRNFRWVNVPDPGTGYCYEDVEFSVKSWRSTADYVSHKYEPRKLMDVLLNAKIDELKFICADFSICDQDIDEILPDALATCNKKFSVKSLHFNVAHLIGLDILQRCDEQLEQISVIFDEPDGCFYALRTVLGIQQVIAAKRLNIFSLGYYSDKRLRAVIDWLLDKVDHDIGKEIIFENDYEPLWQFFSEVTETRRDFLYPTEKIICIRPSNPSKRVWAWQSEEERLINFLVSAAGSDAPNIEEIEKKRDKERKEHELRTRL